MHRRPTAESTVRRPPGRPADPWKTSGLRRAIEIEKRRYRGERFKAIAMGLGLSLPRVQNLLREYAAYLRQCLSGTATSISELRGELTLDKQPIAQQSDGRARSRLLRHRYVRTDDSRLRRANTQGANYETVIRITK